MGGVGNVLHGKATMLDVDLGVVARNDEQGVVDVVSFGERDDFAVDRAEVVGGFVGQRAARFVLYMRSSSSTRAIVTSEPQSITQHASPKPRFAPKSETQRRDESGE